MLRTSFFRSATMVEAIGILSTLQVISQGLVPLVDATGEPYGISRDVVKGAVRAGSALNPPRTGRDESDRPMPALSQVTATPAPNIAINSSESGGGKDLATLGLESVPCTSPLNNRQGYLRYEKIPEQRLVDGTNSKPLDNIRQTKNPVDVLVYCLSKCSNRSGQGFSACKSVNFGPGQEGTSYSGRPPIYSESKCMIAGSTENLRYMPHPTHAEYRTICLSSTGDDEKPKPRSETECPKRLYVIESHWNHQFVLNSSVQFPASTEQKCQELCLNQDGLKQPGQSKFICRSGSFDNVRKKCYLSSLTRRNEKNFFRKVNSKEDVNYFENTCLGAETRCPLSKLIYIKEEGMELDVPYSLSYRNISLDECKMKCTSSKIIFCRSLVYDEKESVCKLSDDDAYTKNTKIAQKGVSYYQLNCNDGLNIKPTTDPNSDSETQPLNQRNYRMVKTAFQLHRRKALVSSLSSNFRNVERDRLTRVTLAECLDACLMEKKYTCRSVMYSDRTDTCKLSDHDTVTGRLVDDRDYDYYKNLMHEDLGNRPGLFPDTFEAGPGSAGQTGNIRPGFNDRFGGTVNGGNSFGGSNSFRPITFNEEANRNDRFGGSSSDSRFGSKSGSGFGSSSTGFGFQRGSNTLGGRDNTFGSGFGSGSNSRFGGDSLSPAFSGGSSFRGSSNSGFSGGGSLTPAFSGGSSVRGSSNSGFGGGSSSGFGGSSNTRTGTRGSTIWSNNDPWRDTNNLRSSDRPSSSNDAPLRGSTGNSNLDFNSRTRLGDTLTTNRFSNSRFGGTNFGVSNRNVINNNNLFSGSGGTTRSSFGGNRFGGSTSGQFTPNRFFGNDNRIFGSGGSDLESSPNERRFQVSLGASNLLAQDIEGAVSQVCNEDGSMEFRLRTNAPFYGRIYTNNHYSDCYYRGGGGTTNYLKISGPASFQDCGTSAYADTTTNIVTIQFSPDIMTRADRRYNLTCTTIGPRESTVTSGYLGTGNGAPIPIEYLPEETRLQSRVNLQILYKNQPTTTVAVGDPLTFRLVSRDGTGLVSDIFATNVVAMDPQTERMVRLIDNRGCPIDPFIFPALGRGRSSNSLETEFNAFMIPESTLMIFQADVRPCRGACEPVSCTVNNGREQVESYGRKRRSANESNKDSSNETETTSEMTIEAQNAEEEYPHYADEDVDYILPEGVDTSVPLKHVNGIFEVYMNREEIPEALPLELNHEVCLSSAQYLAMLTSLIIFILVLVITVLSAVWFYRKCWTTRSKNASADASNPSTIKSQSKSNPRVPFPGANVKSMSQSPRYTATCV